MPIKLNGETGGSVSFDAPDNTSPGGTDVTLTLPTSAGSAGQYLRNSGTAGTLEFGDLPANPVNGFELGTAVDTTTGSEVDFTSIPSWVKEIIVHIYRVSTTASGSLRIQVGTSSGVVTTNYVSTTGFFANGASAGVANVSNGFLFITDSASDVKVGTVVLTSVGGNKWIATGMGRQTSDDVSFHTGSIALSGTLDRVRITTDSSGTFDEGSINIIYKG